MIYLSVREVVFAVSSSALVIAAFGGSLLCASDTDAALRCL
jgi:hypothetical protein